jgi:hypothetical protein
MARQLENWLKTYMEYTAYNEAPLMFHFWAGVGAIGGALRRKAFFKQEYYTWTPNFYIIFVAPPGTSTKSTAMNISANLLGELDCIRFGPNSITWQQMVTSMAEACEMVPMDDGTYWPMSCLTFASSEFGSLLDPDDRKMIDVLCDLWDGQTKAWRKETKSSGKDTVQNPWLNIMACTTPNWLSGNFDRHFIGGGFASRCVFVYADAKRQLIPYPDEDTVPPEARALRPQLIHDLEDISTMTGRFRLTPEAKGFGEEWYHALHKGPPAHLRQASLYGGYLARKQGHVHKLAMVLSASRASDLTITLQDLSDAVRIMDSTDELYPKVFSSITTTAQSEKAIEIVNLVTQRKCVHQANLYAECFFHSMTIKDFKEAVDSAVQAGLIVQEATQRGIFLHIPGIMAADCSVDTPVESAGKDGSNVLETAFQGTGSSRS